MELMTGKRRASLVVLYCIYGSDYKETVLPTVQLDPFRGQVCGLRDRPACRLFLQVLIASVNEIKTKLPAISSSREG